jgi:hypothetical protein
MPEATELFFQLPNDREILPANDVQARDADYFNVL